MAWSCGIVGLPNAGKSTLFKAITALDVDIEAYPFSTIEPNKAVVPLPDRHLDALGVLCGSTTVTPASIVVVDVAGLVKGASRGEGLGNQFLGELRSVEILVHVVAGYDATGEAETDPVPRAETVNLELALADLGTISRRRQKIEAKHKSEKIQESAHSREADLLDRLEEHLNRGRPARLLSLQAAERPLLDELFLLTAKKMIYAYNQSENGCPEDVPAALARLALSDQSPVVPFCARLEAEIKDLSDAAERENFLNEYGLKESRIQQIIEECYRSLELVTFYTVKGEEARAWIIPSGTKAIEAAGKVHSDMARGFINVEVISRENLFDAGTMTAAREKGSVRTEGRDYEVKDGEVLFFRFRN